MAQFGSASALGAEGPRFESGYPDELSGPGSRRREVVLWRADVTVVVEDILVEVEDDLAHGDHASARRRLREALVSRPHRLDLRLRLAAVYRTIGDLPQAGRWGFFDENAPEEEIQAFRTACGDDAALMLEALAWGEDDEGEEDDDAQVTATAWERIAELRRAVAAGRRTEGHHHHRSRLGAPPAVPYPFTPPGGITRPVESPKPRARPQEQLGLLLIFLGLFVVLAFVLALLVGVVWAVGAFVENAYL
jgi:hypothetical protein